MFTEIPDDSNDCIACFFLNMALNINGAILSNLINLDIIEINSNIFDHDYIFKILSRAQDDTRPITYLIFHYKYLINSMNFCFNFYTEPYGFIFFLCSLCLLIAIFGPTIITKNTYK